MTRFGWRPVWFLIGLCLLSSCFGYASEVVIVDYTKQFVKGVDDGNNQKRAISQWLKYERKHKQYLEEIYWRDEQGSSSEDEKRTLVSKMSPQLQERLQQIEWLSKNIFPLVHNLLDFIELEFQYTPHVRVFLAVSPVRIDAKTQWYGNYHDAIHLNAFHSSYSDSENVNILLAHEMYHVLQEQILSKKNETINYNTVWGRLISEGMASCFASLYLPAMSLDRVTFIDKTAYLDIDANKSMLARKIIDEYESAEEQTIQNYFGYGKTRFPPRSGYYLGVFIVRKLMSQYSFKELTFMSVGELKKLFKNELEKIL